MGGDGGPVWTVELQARMEHLQRLAADSAAAQQHFVEQRDAALARLALEDPADLEAAFGDHMARLRALETSVPALAERVRVMQTPAEHAVLVAGWPLDEGGARVTLPVRLGGVPADVPVLFLADVAAAEDDDWFAFTPLEDGGVQGEVRGAFTADPRRLVPLPGVPVDLVRSAAPKPADVVAVRQLALEGALSPVGAARAVLQHVQAVLPEVAALIPGHDGLLTLVPDAEFLKTGIDDVVALRIDPPLPVDFRDAADKAGGLIAPVFDANVLSRLHGPLPELALPGIGPPDLAAVLGDTAILGVPLRMVLPERPDLGVDPPTIEQLPGGAKMTWAGVPLEDGGPLRTVPGETSFTLTVERSSARTETTGRLERFSLVLPPDGTPVVTLRFRALTFRQAAGRSPQLAVEGLEVELGGVMDLIGTLQDALQPLLGPAAELVKTTPKGVKVGYAVMLPPIGAGAFSLSGVGAGIDVDVPFDGSPTVKVAFATPERPFHVSALLLGGEGYLVFEIAETGIKSLEASLSFGGSASISVALVSAEVHALGGVRFALVSGEVEVTGFLEIGGSVDVLGLVSISAELRVELTYKGNALTGRATAVVEVDVTFWSGKIELDSGERTLAGQAAGTAPRVQVTAPVPELPDWRQYRDAFAPGTP